ncbi:MAG TPA: MFS transporter [Firmicutes bacterium]|jgi:predicted MFS family arabinose efflux permease|nr:MFS transporter [Bacillota bacterium]
MTNNLRISIFIAATAAYWGSLYTYVPLLSPYAEHLGAGLTMVGFIVSAYGFSQLLLRVPIGILSDKLGKRRMFMILGGVSSLLAALGIAFTTSPAYLLVFRALSGVAASMWVAYTVLFASYFPAGKTANSMGIMLAVSSSAQLLASWGGSWLAELYGWHAAFQAAVVLAALAVALASLVTDNSAPRQQTLRFSELLGMGKSPQLLMVSILAAFSQYLQFATVHGFTPSFATDVLGATKSQLGLLTLVSTIPTAIASLLGGTWLTKHLPEKLLVIGGFILAGAAALIIPMTSSMPILYVTQVIGGVGRGILFPVLMARSIQTVAPERKATAMGFFQSIYALGMTVGPAVSGILGQIWGIQSVFISAGCIGLIAALLATRALRKSKPAPKAATVTH